MRPSPMPETVVAALRLLLRGAALALLIAYGMLLILRLRLDRPRLDRPRPGMPERLASHWSRLLLRLLGLRVRLHGSAAPAAAGLIVANHVSWLDVPLLCAHLPARFVSKSEVQHWPVAGWLADAAGTFYLRRGRGGMRPLLDRLALFLRGGGSVVIFPEGTTSVGADLLPFHPRLFGAAIGSGTPVQPVTLRYSADARGRPLAPFIGDDDLVSHLLRLLRSPGLAADLHLVEPIDPAGRSREQLAEAAHTAIRTALAPRLAMLAAPVPAADAALPA